MQTARNHLLYCESFTKHREENQKFRETDNLKHLYRNELDKVGAE